MTGHDHDGDDGGLVPARLPESQEALVRTPTPSLEGYDAVRKVGNPVESQHVAAKLPPLPAESSVEELDRERIDGSASPYPLPGERAEGDCRMTGQERLENARRRAAEINAEASKIVFDALLELRKDAGPSSLRQQARSAHAAGIIAHDSKRGWEMEVENGRLLGFGEGDPVVGNALDHQASDTMNVAQHPAGRVDDVILKMATLVHATVNFYSHGVSMCGREMNNITLLAASTLADLVLIGDRPIDPLVITDNRAPAGGDRW